MSNPDRVVHPSAPIEQRVAAMEAVIEKQGPDAAKALEELRHLAQEQWIPQNGARMVAKAWVDPAFRRRLVENGRDALVRDGRGKGGPLHERIETWLTAHSLGARPRG